MSGIHEVYLALALVFASFIAYMFIYNIRQNNRQKAFKLKRQPPLSREEGAEIATGPNEHSVGPGSIS
jgi:hypothetical protein